MTGNCFACGASEPVRHHLTGRGTADAYLDPGLVVPLCRGHHDETHGLLQAAGINRPSALLRDDPVGRVELRQRRTAVGLDVLVTRPPVCGAGPCPLTAFLAVLGPALERWANELAEVLR